MMVKHTPHPFHHSISFHIFSAVTRRVKGSSTSRDCSRSTSPAPQSPMVGLLNCHQIMLLANLIYSISRMPFFVSFIQQVRPPSIRSQLSCQSGPPGPHSPLPSCLLKPRATGIESAGGGGGGATALSDAGDLDSLYTPRSRTPTSSSYGGRSVGGRSIKVPSVFYFLNHNPNKHICSSSSLQSWRSRGGETPNSGSISSSGGPGTGTMGGTLLSTSSKEYQERPVVFTASFKGEEMADGRERAEEELPMPLSFIYIFTLSFQEFVELFRLFNTRMRKVGEATGDDDDAKVHVCSLQDLKDLFNEFVIASHSSANSHVPKRTSGGDKCSYSPRVPSRLESVSQPDIPFIHLFCNKNATNNLQVNSCPPTNEFMPDDALTRNSALHLCQLNEKQQKIYSALALASVSCSVFDTSRNVFLTPAALRQFICTQVWKRRKTMKGIQ